MGVRWQLIFPFVDLKTEYFDLGLPHRDETNDKVTVDAAHAILVRRPSVASASAAAACALPSVSAAALHATQCSALPKLQAPRPETVHSIFSGWLLLFCSFRFLVCFRDILKR